MHNNTNYHGWNKALTFGVGSIQLSFRTIVFTQYISIQMSLSNCAEGLHFSAFHYYSILFYTMPRYPLLHIILHNAQVPTAPYYFTQCPGTHCSILFYTMPRYPLLHIILHNAQVPTAPYYFTQCPGTDCSILFYTMPRYPLLHII